LNFLNEKQTGVCSHHGYLTLSQFGILALMKGHWKVSKKKRRAQKIEKRTKNRSGPNRYKNRVEKPMAMRKPIVPRRDWEIDEYVTASAPDQPNMAMEKADERLQIVL
jgi:hypothetical protein